jgi:hypothetical protein
MSRHHDIVSLRELSTDLVRDALRRVRSHREKESPPDKARFETAEIYLAEALEYVSGAWDAILSKRPKVAVAVSRWILEASCNVFWVVADENQLEDRLKKIVAEALRNDANLWVELAKLWPREEALFLRQAGRARAAREKLGVKEKRLQSRAQGDQPRQRGSLAVTGDRRRGGDAVWCGGPCFLAIESLVAQQADRHVAIWLRVRLGGERMTTVAGDYGYRDGSGVHPVVQRLKKKAENDQALARRLKALAKQVSSAKR